MRSTPLLRSLLPTRQWVPATAFLLLALMLGPGRLNAQTSSPPPQQKSTLKAFALNLLLPGLGQRYLNNGRWSTSAVLFTGADISLGLGLTGTIWYRRQQTEAYRTLAATDAAAQVQGKERSFFIQMSNHRSQKAFVNHLLRSRQWNRLDKARASARFWTWESEKSWRQFRLARRKADALARRRSILITALVANRLISGVLALLQTPQAAAQPQTNLTLRPSANNKLVPHLKMRFQW